MFFIKDFFLGEMKFDITKLYEFHMNDKLVKGLNCVFIALISKVENSEGLSDFRPISLVGCMYKVLDEVLANRLWKVLGNAIFYSQLTFAKERYILDGILIANEVMDEVRKLKKEVLLSKVDFEKKNIWFGGLEIFWSGNEKNEFSNIMA